MKLIFYKGYDIISKIIQFFTKSDYAHVGLYITEESSEPMVYESKDFYGVRCVPISYYKNYDGEVWLADIFPQPDIPQLLKSVKWNLNQPYSWAEIVVLFFRIVFKIRIPYHVSRTEYICSEYVATKLDECGVAIVPWPELVTPAELAKSLFITKWTRLS